ncbi:hypothetical protein JKA74_00025 [Marivirga sp. S37H4]|uniref:Uncharacterized protein n=1 Tax=Marivirga aurantiaca TaxID=2802615 RepID=A0A934WUX9_9BACT|nr:hypothetical protein [Marivirga aurantiaca]MBK6263401.1 hypothetical protein [Marivirga aurantiaca]
MKYIFALTLTFFLFNIQTNGQELVNKWANSVSNIEGFLEIDKSKFDKWDLSNILSNQTQINPLSTYIGVFGPKYRRIDFHLMASKKEGTYEVTGKSKLGNNIQNLNGEFNLRKVFYRKQDYISDTLYIGVFDYILREPGLKEGDGEFRGTFSVVFYRINNQIQIFKTSSGDEPNFTNTFVGAWKRYNSDVERTVIFSFHPAGLYERLPYCEPLYSTKDMNDDFTIIKEEFIQYGWEDFNYNGQKSNWWK